jgi:putative tricarboxylic transport membrane protein
MKTRGNLIVAIFFLLLGLFGVVQSLTFRFWESITLPLAVSGVIFITASIEIAKELRRRSKRAVAASETSGKESNSGGQLGRLWRVFAWAAGLVLATYLLGFYIAGPLFSLAYLRWRGRGWLASIIFAAAMLAFLYGVFELGLKSPLYRGFLFGAR